MIVSQEYFGPAVSEPIISCLLRCLKVSKLFLQQHHAHADRYEAEVKHFMEISQSGNASLAQVNELMKDHQAHNRSRNKETEANAVAEIVRLQDEISSYTRQLLHVAEEL